MKNIVLCFDRPEERSGAPEITHVKTAFCLFGNIGGQTVWYHPCAGTRSASDGRRRVPWRGRESAVDAARATIVAAYRFLVDRWEPDDRIYLFGVGRGGYCAVSLARLLGTVGVLPNNSDGLLDYALATYAVPRTQRSAEDWQRLTGVARQLAGGHDVGVPVRFLGLWDAVKPPGLPRTSAAEPLTNVLAGRHARAIDNSPPDTLGVRSECVDEVWFRGSHRDVAGTVTDGPAPADISLDWVLDGAAAAGAVVSDTRRGLAPTPTEASALADASRTLSLHRPPENASVHASVDIYLRAHPQYWRRLPARVVWADRDWLARGERLVCTSDRPTVAAAPQLLTAAS